MISSNSLQKNLQSDLNPGKNVLLLADLTDSEWLSLSLMNSMNFPCSMDSSGPNQYGRQIQKLCQRLKWNCLTKTMQSHEMITSEAVQPFLTMREQLLQRRDSCTQNVNKRKLRGTWTQISVPRMLRTRVVINTQFIQRGKLLNQDIQSRKKWNGFITMSFVSQVVQWSSFTKEHLRVTANKELWVIAGSFQLCQSL